jgi:hypothetical protein
VNKPLELKRKETITVASTYKNDYGDLIVADTTGKEHKIGSKRAKLFDLFVPETVIELGIAEYMEKEYVASAKPFAGPITRSEKPQVTPTVATIKAAEDFLKAAPKTATSGDASKNRAMAVAYAKDLAVAGKIQVNEIIVKANEFLTFIESGKV